ncbi:MAG TPA: 2-dehydropantoate 2-reductase [Verrucomicrobiae bacterium]|nr:2-dehydropantoate 2-reductase [Verrucomicrobiae bacterium]
MKIAMVGCGAVGSYYGAMLSRAGREVHLLLRSDYEVVRRNGVRIQSPAGDFVVRPKCARMPEEIGVADLVFIALKTTANVEFPKLLLPLVGPQTAVVTLQNGLGNEEELAKRFPVEQILGGLCFVCLNRIAPGVIQHLDHGLMVLGEHQRYPEPRTHEIATMVRHAGVPCKVTDNLARAHWEKLVWNIPFNGLGVASVAGYEALAVPRTELQIPGTRAPCLTTDILLSDARWARLVRELMLEVVAAANAQGLGVSESLVEKLIERTRAMGAYKASTLLDFEQGRPLELDSLFLEPLRQAQRAGVATPRLASLCEILRRLNPA